MGWYKKAFGHDYLKIYSNRNESEAKQIIKFAVQVLNLQPGQKVLDLACGYGRNSVECAKYKLDVFGLDLSPELLSLAQRKGMENGYHIPVVRGDMRELPFCGSFDAVLSLFTSFGYFDSDVENEKVIRAAARVLKPGGLFLFDYLNIIQALPNMTIRDSRVKDNIRVVQERFYNKETNRIEKKISVHEDGDIREYVESVRAYHLIELLHFFENSGLNCTAVFGDYDIHPFTQHSPRLILIGQKL
ncbi:class I SAM-dependent methyltransferase [candidate division KSB1 bacterium]|nr:class I SAM-dependent methyltransferase [candidate division KSB1 bacterium]